MHLYLQPETVKTAIKIPESDSLDDADILRGLVAATGVIDSNGAGGRRFQPYWATRHFTAKNPQRLLLNGDLLSVTSLKTDWGQRTYAQTLTDYDLEPEDALNQNPPRPYWEIRIPQRNAWGTGRRDLPCHVSRGVQIEGRWGFYDVRRLLGVTLVAPNADDEIQLLTPGGTINGGSFTLNFLGDETAPIGFDATAADIQAALELLPSIGAGNIIGTGGPIATDVVTLTFAGALASTDVSQIHVDDMDLTGVAPTLIASTFHQGSSGSGTVDASTTTITVSAEDEVLTGHTLRIDDEDLFVSAVNGADCTVTRGENGSVAASHSGGAAIEVYEYPVVDQACMILMSRYLRRSKDSPYGIVGSIDGFMRLAINDPDVVALLSGLRLAAVGAA